MKLNITVEKILCAKVERKWYFFRASVTPEDGSPEYTILCKGSMQWTPQLMETISLIGDFVTYKGERQFQFKSAKLTLPLDPRAQLHYICERTHGIGSSLEQAIWDQYRENYKELQDGSIKKMTPKICEEFQKQVKAFFGNKDKAETISWLESHGCTEAMSASAYEQWGEQAPAIVNSNCYRLAELSGFSFKTVDENIRSYFGIADNDERRLRSGIEYAIQQETSDGSTAIECWRHLAACGKLLPNIGNEIIIEIVRKMKEEGQLYIFPEQGLMSLKSHYVNEQAIQSFIEKNKTSVVDITDMTDDILTADESFAPDITQLEAVRHAVSHKFAVINGGAGVGKTTVIKMIAKGILYKFPEMTISLCAFAGKAAARLKEASGLPATTIHVLLQSNGQIFSAGPLENTAVIVDESSMVDSALMAEIIKRNPAKLILVGDQAQLPPVGAGQPFHDIINLYPECVRTLTKCYRNKEAVFNAATEIRNGNIPPRYKKSENETWTICQVSDPSIAQNMVVSWAQNGELDFEKDIILCPKNGSKNEEGLFQLATVNSLNQELLFLDREKRGSLCADKFIVGDRVINTKNFSEDHVWNGTTGTIQAVNQDNEVFVKLDIPVNFGDEKIEVVKFDKEMIPYLQYAYALTIHKSQGSQYRKVILLALPRDQFQLERSLIYTGITRTKQDCIVVGDFNTIIKGIGTVRHKSTVMQCLYMENIK